MVRTATIRRGAQRFHVLAALFFAMHTSMHMHVAAAARRWGAQGAQGAHKSTNSNRSSLTCTHIRVQHGRRFGSNAAFLNPVKRKTNLRCIETARVGTVPTSTTKVCRRQFTTVTSTSLSLSSSKSDQFEAGDQVYVEVDGAQYEGWVRSKKGGWYTIEIRNEDGSDTTTVKKRGTQLSRRMSVAAVESSTSTSTSTLTPNGNASLVNKSTATVTSSRIGTIMDVTPALAATLSEVGVGINRPTNSEDVRERVLAPVDIDIANDIDAIPEMISDKMSAPTIIDLDALLNNMKSGQDQIRSKKDQLYLQQCKSFSHVKKWVTFTDLHCAPATLTTCIHVLSAVHAKAKRENAGVLFLGDFWHHRGTVRVDCLNAVLHALSEWEVPMIMLPGNHDQVSLGGEEHALTPLQNAYRVPDMGCNDNEAFGSESQSSPTAKTSLDSVPGILIFSVPTKFQNALFVPHIRDTGTMQSVLQSKVSASSSAVFVHADVTGAYMNDSIISTHGIAPAYFPPSIPIYSGHFHKPHTIVKPEAAPGVSIRYVGSPYETTLSEAGQKKALLVLDSSHNWECIDESALSLGKKHWRVKNIEELLDLQVMNSSNMNDSISGPVELVSAGDRVVVSVHQEDLEDLRRKAKHNVTSSGAPALSAFDAKVKELRSVGASVEIREKKSNPFSNRADSGKGISAPVDDLDWLLVEDMTPLSTWTNYLESEVNRDALKNSTASVLLEAGNNILEELGCETVSSSGNGNVDDNSIARTNLCLETITVKGFGPFKEEVTYPLMDRGLVLVRGSNRDGGSDSNGSGKSSLAMSALWALTGSIDPRPVSDAKVSDVIHDNSKTAKVAIRGSINGASFVISRTKSASRGSLNLILDGEDLTKQSAKETQNAIDEVLGVNNQVLSRTIFHGQHTINGLLEASDAKLKEELSIIVPLKLWQDAAARARKQGRHLSKRVSELDGMVLIRNQDTEKIKMRLERANEDVATREMSLTDKGNEISERLLQLQSLEGQSFSLEEIQQGVDEAAKKIEFIEAELNNIFTDLESELTPIRLHLKEETSLLHVETSELQNLESNCYRSDLSLSSATDNLKSLQEKYGIVYAADLSSFTIPETPSICPTCSQPMVGDSHGHYVEEVKKNVLDAESEIESAAGRLRIDQGKVETQKTIVQTKEIATKQIISEIDVREGTWKKQQTKFQNDLQKARLKYSEKSAEFAKGLKILEVENEAEQLKASSESELNILRESLKAVIHTRDALAKDLEDLSADIKDIENEREDARSDGTLMTISAENFGARGVQTFILQNTVHALQLASQSYLDELSDGTLKLQLNLDAGDKITRTASVLSSNGSWISRPLSSLSGGQWRRCSLALSLGFSDLVARRGKLCSSLLVLDEPLTHLDSSGRDNVGKLLRKVVQKQASEQFDGEKKRIGGLSVSTILIILQDLVAEELSESFDKIDEVVKCQGHSKVVIDEERVLLS